MSDSSPHPCENSFDQRDIRAISKSSGCAAAMGTPPPNPSERLAVSGGIGVKGLALSISYRESRRYRRGIRQWWLDRLIRRRFLARQYPYRPGRSDATSAPQINRISGKVIIALSLIALLAVLSGYFQPPQPDEGTAAHIFQLSIVALAPMLLLFLATTDWRRPSRGARPLAFPVAALVVAFAALYYLEHYR